MGDKDLNKAIFGCVFIIVALLVALYERYFGDLS